MSLVLIAADLAAIAVLIALFLSRHHRRDLVVAYLGVNVGVLAVAAALSTMTALWPEEATACAADRPAGPPPTMRTGLFICYPLPEPWV